MVFKIMRPTSLAAADPEPTTVAENEPATGPVMLPYVGAIVLYRSYFGRPGEYAVVPAIVTGVPDQLGPRTRANLHIFHDGPRPSEFARNVSHAPCDSNQANSWHWPN